MKILSTLVGVVGETFVAAELSRRSYIASTSMRNTRGINILATNEEATHSITIQCKANQDGGASWILNKKAEDFAPKNHFYVFVALTSPEERPRYHVVPASVVAEYTSRTHKEWLAGDYRRKDSAIRNFRDKEGAFLDRWDLLGLD